MPTENAALHEQIAEMDAARLEAIREASFQGSANWLDPIADARWLLGYIDRFSKPDLCLRKVKVTCSTYSTAPVDYGVVLCMRPLPCDSPNHLDDKVGEFDVQTG